MSDPVFGRLDWRVTPFDDFWRNPTANEAVASGAALVVILGAVAVAWFLTSRRLWRPLWRDWLTSADHKKIGIMYVVLAGVMFLRAVAEGFVMRTHQVTALDGGFLSPDHFAQLFSTHGTIMIFFVATPLITGLINFVVPLQIGARDMAFPVMNQVSLGLTAAGAGLVMISLVVGQFGTGGWTMYPPYTGATFSPGPGVDYWIWAIGISGIGSTLSGINFAVTIYKMRAPGVRFLRMPMFTWTALTTAIMMVYAFPPLTVSNAMLALDRYLDFHFFTNDLGGNMMHYANIFWMFGHPEVYIVVLPAYGVFSEISSTFAAKRLYGYNSLVIATLAIAVISFCVWLHHFFTMGQGASVNAAFGIATMIIAVPTGVKVYDWLATLYEGRIRMSVPIIYLTGFFILFVFGGLTGVILANPTLDYQVHNSQFLVAHFHNVLIPGTLFGVFAGIHYWFPKAFGFRLDERLARRAAYLWFAGFCLAFLPLYWLGLMGMPRRAASYENAAFESVMWLTFAGAVIVLAALGTMIWTFVASARNRAALACPIGDPWDGRSLEWATAAPAPEWNFAATPEVEALDPFTIEKAEGEPYQPAECYEDIEVPRNTAMGVVIGGLTGVMGFALVWWMWWLAALALAGVVAAIVARAFVTDTHQRIGADELRQAHRDFLDRVAATEPVNRDLEMTSRNRGRADPEAPA
ncbi:cbb3-type cytochrome c oxidase subunit I [Roseovarius sp. SCSIO 43702]|uniref:cbb3-type cytochrome c oxidase subunit I n=1 Tax=Roseovarius sp. SCSIO 43702 TaxID=2823043 RepID=UPI001C73A660|nr:cbb3-type cytochrome c oxidase subunit I [Roseovarius sp. SCSIO 43702]QYX56002.1 cbb3-type cytochrome c oxidase subunit I [Roseovarius sp. SCSIO 43702]